MFSPCISQTSDGGKFKRMIVSSDNFQRIILIDFLRLCNDENERLTLTFLSWHQ